jgi:hypothetical protein
MTKVARPKKAKKNTLENGFISYAPPQKINRETNILE